MDTMPEYSFLPVLLLALLLRGTHGLEEKYRFGDEASGRRCSPVTQMRKALISVRKVLMRLFASFWLMTIFCRAIALLGGCEIQRRPPSRQLASLAAKDGRCIATPHVPHKAS